MVKSQNKKIYKQTSNTDYLLYNIEGKITECWLVETEGIFS